MTQQCIFDIYPKQKPPPNKWKILKNHLGNLVEMSLFRPHSRFTVLKAKICKSLLLMISIHQVQRGILHNDKRFSPTRQHSKAYTPKSFRLHPFSKNWKSHCGGVLVKTIPQLTELLDRRSARIKTFITPSTNRSSFTLIEHPT